MRIDDFAKTELRIGEILEAIPDLNADRLLVLKMSFGSEGTRQIWNRRNLVESEATECFLPRGTKTTSLFQVPTAAMPSGSQSRVAPVTKMCNIFSSWRY